MIGSGSGSDLDSIRSVDPDLESFEGCRLLLELGRPLWRPRDK